MATGIFLSCMREQVELDSLNFSNINFEYDIAISGFISTDRTRHRVTLTAPTPIDGDIGFSPISDAVVTLTDGVNTYPLEWVERKGAYLSVDSIQGVPGVYYTLEVMHKGKVYTASDTLPLYPIRDYINLKLDDTPQIRAQRLTDNNWIMISIYHHVFGYDSSAIMFFNHINSTYSDSIMNQISDIVNLSQGNRIYLHRGSLPQGVLPPVYSFLSSAGASTDTAELVYMALSNSYYEYVISVLNETDWNAGLFSTLPGNTKGNVSKGGVGYFYAVNVSRFRLSYLDLIGD